MEYGITAKPITSVNTMSNAVLKRIHQVLGNLVRNFNIYTQTYVDKNDPSGAFVILSTANRMKGYSLAS